MTQNLRPKVLFASLFLLLAAAAVALFFHLKKDGSAFRAIPSNAAIVLEINGLSATLGQFDALEPAWRTGIGAAFFETVQHDLATARRIFPAQTPVGAALEKRPFAAGLTLSDADTLHAVFALDFGAKTALETWLAANHAIAKTFPANFRGETIFTLQLAENERFAVAAVGEMLLFSRLPYLVEEAVVALSEAENVWADSHFRDLASAEQNGARLFLNAAALAEQWSGKMAAGWGGLPAVLAKNLRWLRFDWDGHEAKIHAATTGFLAALGGARAPRAEIFSILPDNLALLLWSAIGSKQAFFQQLSPESAGDFARFIAPWAGDDMAFALAEPFSSGLAEEQFLVISVQDSARESALMARFGERFGVLQNYDYQTFTIRRFASGGPLAPLNEAFRSPAYVRLGRYAVFAHSTAAAELLVDKHVVSQTLVGDADFLRLAKKLPTAGNALLLFNARYLPALTKTVFAPGAELETAGALAKTGLLALDFLPEKTGRAHMAAAVQPPSERPAATAETSAIWKTSLAAEAVTQPFVLEKPGGGEAAIVVQDGTKQLYRLGANGEIKWRRRMDDWLRSAVFGLDYLGNQSLCYLFSTATHIYLLDDEGRDVEGFPLVLKSPATCGVSLARFSKSSDYAFFIGCANGNLYGFDQHGRPLPGWNPQAGVGPLAWPLAHFQQPNRDFLVALTRSGRLFAFGRHGDRWFAPVQMEGKAIAPPQADLGKSLPRIACASADGRALACNFSGEFFGLGLGAAPLRSFVFAPLAGDGRKDYAALSGQKIEVRGYAGDAFKTLISSVLPVAADTIFEIKTSATASQLGALARSKRQIFLLDQRGKLLPDFPLAGSTPFAVADVFGTGRSRVLIVGNGASVCAYALGK